MLIAVEGIDGSGKTTQSFMLVDGLIKKGFRAVYTTEPTYERIGDILRLHVSRMKIRMPVYEALLFSADRFEHITKFIEPKIESGAIIVSDRYVYSTIAYQGAAGLDLQWIKDINRNVLKPNLAIYIAVPIEVALQRYKNKRSVMERPVTQKAVHRIYLQLVEEGEMIPISGNRPVKEVAKDIRTLVLEHIQG